MLRRTFLGYSAGIFSGSGANALDGATLPRAVKNSANTPVDASLTRNREDDLERLATQLASDNANLRALLSATPLDNFAALRRLTRLDGQNVITVTGGKRPGDGLGGTFIYDPEDLAMEDDGSSVIVCADGARWKRVSESAGSVPSLIYAQAGAESGAYPVDSTVSIRGFKKPGDGGEFVGVVEAANNTRNPLAGRLSPSGPAVSTRMWGDDAGAIKRAIEYGSPVVEVTGFTVIDSISAVMQANLRLVFHPNAVLQCEGGGAEIAFSIDTNGYDLVIEGSGLIDGRNEVPIIGQIVNNTPTESRLTMRGGPIWRNAYRRASRRKGSAAGLWIRGLIRASLQGVVIENVSREAGGGRRGKAGSSGLVLFNKKVNSQRYWPVAPEIINCRCDNVTSEEIVGTRTNTDCDALKINTGGSSNPVMASNRCVIRNFSALNPRGRAIKTQSANVDIDGVFIQIEDGKPSIERGGSLINCQSSPILRLANVEAFITAHQEINWFNNQYQGSLIGLYTGKNNSRPATIATISNVTATVSANVGTGFKTLIGAESGYSRDRPTALTATNVNCHAETKYLLMTAIANDDATQFYSLTNVTAKKIAVSAVGHNARRDQQNRIYLTNCGHDGPEVPAITLKSNPRVIPKVPIEGFGLRNIASASASAFDNNAAPARIQTIAPTANGMGGAVNFETAVIGDEETYVCRPSGASPGRGLVFIGTNHTSDTQAAFAAGGLELILLNGAGGGLYAIGNGINPDADGKINVWLAPGADGRSCLHIKNRIGSKRTFTITYQG